MRREVSNKARDPVAHLTGQKKRKKKWGHSTEPTSNIRQGETKP